MTKIIDDHEFEEWRKPGAIQARLEGHIAEGCVADIKHLLETAIGGGTIDLAPTPPDYPTQHASQNDLLLRIYAIVMRASK